MSDCWTLSPSFPLYTNVFCIFHSYLICFSPSSLHLHLLNVTDNITLMDHLRLSFLDSSSPPTNGGKTSRSSSISSGGGQSATSDDDLSSRMSITDLLAAAEFLEKSERQKDCAIVKRPMTVVCPAALAAQKLPYSVPSNLNNPKKRDLLPAMVPTTQLLAQQHQIQLLEETPVPPVASSSSPTNNIYPMNVTRASHNELEKNRRAHLRACLEKLKDLIPCNVESNRYTTLSLLTRATCFVKTLEDQRSKLRLEKNTLIREQELLKAKLQSSLSSTSDDYPPITSSPPNSAARCSSTGTLDQMSSTTANLDRPNSMPDRMFYCSISGASSTDSFKRKRSISECSESTISADEAANSDTWDENDVADFTVSTSSPPPAKKSSFDASTTTTLRSFCSPDDVTAAQFANRVINSPTLIALENANNFTRTGECCNNNHQDTNRRAIDPLSAPYSYYVPTVVTHSTPTTSSTVNSSPPTAINVADRRPNLLSNEHFLNDSVYSAQSFPLPRFVVPPCVSDTTHKTSSSTNVDSSPFYEPLFSRITLQALLDQYARACGPLPQSPPCVPSTGVTLTQALMPL
uniref:BHLH domain-containing protein n=1 Tax=Romanomermis culicivorax TaxID=13658 RepID=A0A915K1L8_ROMCU